MKYEIKTFGCKVNTYDTGLLQTRLKNAGFTMDGVNPSVHILNTCAVTREATKEAVKTIRQLKAKNPFCTVVVTGCGAQVDTDSFRNLPGADLVIANSHKGQLEDILKKYYAGLLKEKVFHSNIFKKEDLEEGGGVEEGHTRAFIKIQDGCNSFCTYCVIPFARGKSRSIPVGEIVRRVNQLNQDGIDEVVITGVHIGDYESDENGKKLLLEDLIENLLIRTKVQRFRLSSLEPIELSERLLDLYQDPRMCPHFHMSIQSANDRVLQQMKRKYLAKDVEECLLKIDQRVKNAFVGMDVIVGFPGETNDEFHDTFSRLEKLPWTRIHVFPYSMRPGTKAEKLTDHVAKFEIMKRAKALRDLSSDRYAEKALEQIGAIKKVMVLKNKSEVLAQGLSRDYWPITFNMSASVQIGKEVSVKVIGFDNSHISRMDGCLNAELVMAESL